MGKSNRYQYFVEGQTEKKLIEVFKSELTLIQAGTVNVFDVKKKRLSNAMLANILSNTIVILVFDTDTKDIGVLSDNIRRLKRSRNVKEIWCVMQVNNLEEELLRATDVREIKELIGCRSNKDFKRDMIREKRLMEKLQNHGFDFEKIWIAEPPPEYRAFSNNGHKIKL